jgi:hypothetical protein
MIQLELQGFEEVEALLVQWERLLQSDELWDPATRAAAEEFKRYAESISPVITGSYKRAHTIVPVEGMSMAVVIDEGAVNPISGARVIEYAGPVENRHHVYQRTFDRAGGRAGVAGVDAIVERLR